jgi:hypothetical protein
MSRYCVAVLTNGTTRAGPASEASALGLGCALRLVAKHQGSAEHDNIT